MNKYILGAAGLVCVASISAFCGYISGVNSVRRDMDDRYQKDLQFKKNLLQMFGILIGYEEPSDPPKLHLRRIK